MMTLAEGQTNGFWKMNIKNEMVDYCVPSIAQKKQLSTAIA